jgi:hypothetical protein
MAGTAPPFKLQVLIREVADELGSIPNSPQARHAAAREVLKRVPTGLREEVAVLTMMYFIQWTVSGWRAKIRTAPPEAPAAAAVSPAASVNGLTAAEGDEVAAVRARRQGSGSANSANCGTDAVMRRVGRVLRNTTYSLVQDKSLAEYTAEDLEAVASYLEVKASEYAEKALQYRNVIAHMTALNAKVVIDLPAELLDEIFCHKKAA